MMKLSKALASAVIVTFFTATAVFAAPDVSGRENSAGIQQKFGAAKLETKDYNNKGPGFKHDCGRQQQDPVEALKGRKEKVESLLKEGKITKEKADAIKAKIDTRIKEIEKFNSLPLQQKKAKLISDFKAKVGEGIKNGRLTQEKANELIKSFTEKIQNWDGKGYPHFHAGMHKDRQHSDKENSKRKD